MFGVALFFTILCCDRCCFSKIWTLFGPCMIAVVKMAMTSGPSVEENLGIKVQGDLGDFQIVEEKSESEDSYSPDIDKSSRAVSTLSTLPQDVVKPTAPVFGSVSVSNSENVQFGNNTYFNGPVTIKQVVHNSSEHDNPGYEHTEDETSYVSPKSESKIHKESTIKKLEVKLWLKLTFSAVFFIAVGGVCAIISITLSNQGQSNDLPGFNEEEKAANSMVEGSCYSVKNKLFLIPLLVVLLTFVRVHVILTKENVTKGSVCGAMKRLSTKHAKISYDAEADPLLIAPNHLRIVSRTNWLAKPVEKPLDVLKLPAPWVIITHTDTEGCFSQSECVLRVRLIQTFHVESRKWFDIGYNFLVAGDGSAYYGRGWDFQGAHTLGYNKYSIGIAFIGTFSNYAPPKKQLDAAQKLISQGVALGKIAKDYKLFGHRQLASTLSPGDRLYDIIKEWPHFVKNDTDISELVPNY